LGGTTGGEKEKGEGKLNNQAIEDHLILPVLMRKTSIGGNARTAEVSRDLERNPNLRERERMLKHRKQSHGMGEVNHEIISWKNGH